MSLYRSEDGARAVRERYLQLLDDWPVDSRRLTLPTRAGETFVLACGPEQAPPVLALQGSGANTAMWRQQITAWAPHLRVYAVDLIGEPGLSAPTRPPLGSDAYAEWLDDVLDGLGLDRAAFVGVSLGGWIALDYAARRPDRVTRLALLAPSGVGRGKTGVLLAAAILRLFGARGRRRTLRLVLGPVARTAPPPDPAFADLLRLIFTYFRPRPPVIPRFDDATLGRLTMPVLAVVGARDALLDSAGTARRLTANVADATVRVLPGAGHLLPDQATTVLDFCTAARLH